jgi:bifunctional DNA-binding transcriptional regulator/antitoxin component of YhaV-PrlF toxin-antitoxin module
MIRKLNFKDGDILLLRVNGPGESYELIERIIQACRTLPQLKTGGPILVLQKGQKLAKIGKEQLEKALEYIRNNPGAE